MKIEIRFTLVDNENWLLANLYGLTSIKKNKKTAPGEMLVLVVQTCCNKRVRSYRDQGIGWGRHQRCGHNIAAEVGDKW